MRITKAMQETIFENIIADGHPLRVRADKVMYETAALAHGIITEIQESEGLTNPADIAAIVNDVMEANAKGKSFVDTSTTTSRVYYGDNEQTIIYGGNFSLYIGGQVRTIDLDGELDKDNRINSDLPTPGISKKILTQYIGLYKPNARPMLPGDHPAADTLARLCEEIKAINGEYVALKSAVFATLHKFTTVKKLVAAWPEIEKYIPNEQKPLGTGLALSREDLNAICGIPK